MSKRLMAWVLSCALLLGALSGLTLISGAEGEDAGATYAKIDFTSGESVLTNATITDDRTNNDNVVQPITCPIEQYDGEHYGKKVYTTQNNNPAWNGSSVRFKADQPLPEGDVAISVEYFLPENAYGNNTRICVTYKGADDKDVTIETNASKLVKGAPAILTVTVDGEEAKKIANSGDVTVGLFHNGNGGDYFYLLSATIFPASELKTIENPGYDYYDFANPVALNPYYPEYATANVYGLEYVFAEGSDGGVTEKGLEQTVSGGYLYFRVTNALTKDDIVKPVCIRLIFAEGTSGSFDMNYEGEPVVNEKDEINRWKAQNGNAIANRTMALVLTDSAFQNQLNSQASFRLSNFYGKILERIEVYSVNKDSLAAVIEAAKTEDLTDKSLISLEAFQNALKDAETVAADADATDEAILAAFQKLAAAESRLTAPIAVKEQTTIDCTEFFALNGGNVEDHGNYSCIGSTYGGLYLEYPVNVEKTGFYTVSFNIATDLNSVEDSNGTRIPNGNAYHLSIRNDKGGVYGTVSVPFTGGWQEYGTFKLDKVLLQAGQQTLRIFFDDGGVNYKDMTLTLTDDKTKEVELPDPNWTSIDEGKLFQEFKDTRCIALTNGVGFSYNNASIANALGLTSDDVVKLDIALDYYWEDTEFHGGDWWRFRTTNEDGTYTWDDGFSLMQDAGLTDINAWHTVTISRANQRLGVAGLDDWFLQTASMNGTLYIRGFQYTATTKDGLQLTGVWGRSFEGVDATLAGYNLTLDGDIGLNYYLKVGDDFNKNGATVQVKLPSESTTSALGAPDYRGYYRITANVAAKEMTDIIPIVLKDTDGNCLSTSYSVMNYSAYLLAHQKDNTEYADAAELIQSMLNYGANAQKYFEYNCMEGPDGGKVLNESKLANAFLKNTDKDVSSVTAETLKSYSSFLKFQGNDQIKLSAANLSLLSETTLRLFFTVTEGQLIGDFTFKDGTGNVLNAQEYTLTNGETYYYVEIANIAAHVLSADVTVTVQAEGMEILTVTYNPMAYCYNALNATSTSEELKDTVRALYLYNQEAIAYKNLLNAKA